MRLTDAELETTKRNAAKATATLAVEGIHLTPDETTFMNQLIAERLPAEERRRRLLDYSRHRRASIAAE
jgi:hypothetical protein